MRTLFKRANIVTLSEDENILIKGHLIVNGSTIETVQSGDFQGDDGQFEQIIDVNDQVLLPGLINTHGHAAMTLLRSAADDLPLQEWLEKKIWPVEDRMTEKDIYWGTQLAIWEMIASGSTTFTDMYFFEDKVAEVVEQTGIRAVLSRGMIGFLPEKAESTARESYNFIKQYQESANGRITTMLAPHAPYTCPEDFLRDTVIPMAKELNTPIQIHLSETRFEVNQSFKQHQKSPIEWIADLGLFEIPTIAAHVTHVSNEDIELLSKHRVSIAHNPQSNLKLGSGIAPILPLLEAGLQIGLGTDGAASNNDLDMWEEIRLVATLHKGVNENPIAIPARLALELGTRRGANALFFKNGLGSLVPGAPADLQIISTDQPHWQPKHDLIAQLVYGAKSSDVTDVMVNGQFIMRKREFLTMDTERIAFEVANCIHHLYK